MLSVGGQGTGSKLPIISFQHWYQINLTSRFPPLNKNKITHHQQSRNLHTRTHFIRFLLYSCSRLLCQRQTDMADRAILLDKSRPQNDPR
ncbi:hypothetical protein VTH06DRAFT_1801 [Thermothelomyces fergusii]